MLHWITLAPLLQSPRRQCHDVVQHTHEGPMESSTRFVRAGAVREALPVLARRRGAFWKVHLSKSALRDGRVGGAVRRSPSLTGTAVQSFSWRQRWSWARKSWSSSVFSITPTAPQADARATRSSLRPARSAFRARRTSAASVSTCARAARRSPAGADHLGRATLARAERRGGRSRSAGAGGSASGAARAAWLGRSL